MIVEVQFTSDCPNAAVLVACVEQIAHDHADVTLRLTEVSLHQAVPTGFAGSPTVLVDGVNPFGGRHVDSAACAVHPPTVDAVEAAIASRREASERRN